MLYYLNRIWQQDKKREKLQSTTKILKGDEKQIFNKIPSNNKAKNKSLHFLLFPLSCQHPKLKPINDNTLSENTSIKKKLLCEVKS